MDINDYVISENKVRKWMESVIKGHFAEDFTESLITGIPLCHLLLTIDSTLIPYVNYPSTSNEHKYKENIEFFIQGIEEYGVKQTFTVTDLTLKQNLPLVMNSLIELANVAELKGYYISLPPIEEKIDKPLTTTQKGVKKLMVTRLELSKAHKTFSKNSQGTARTGTPSSHDRENIIKFQAIARGYIERKRLLVLKRKNAYRIRVAKEILYTEIKYVNSLGNCIELFINPLQNALIEKSKLNDTPILNRTIIRTLFSDLKIIHKFHLDSILTSVFQRVEKWNLYQCLGDIFMQIVSKLKIYTQYIINYTNSSRCLHKLQEDSSFAEWKYTQEAKIKGMTLQSLLIMPVQRLPRYILLLTDLFKHTWEDHPDYHNLEQAATEMEKLTAFLDEKKLEAENQTRFKALAVIFKGKIDINLTEPHRKFVREDKFGNKNVYLFNDIIIISENDIKNKGKQQKKPNLSVRYYWLRKLEIIETTNGFQLKEAGVISNLLDIENTLDIQNTWVSTFKEYQEIAIALKLNELHGAMDTYTNISLTRNDSVLTLQHSLDVLQNHMSSIDSQFKVVKNRKDKKQYSKLIKSLDKQAKDIDKKLVEKVAQRKQKGNA